ncbi:MAG TPA: hypothetical protein VG676_08425 [Chitinophagaceae bacterium]|jgi:hypothetical protein|nr:hypothetical protein [Chitinophagaceae bacterium]
MGKASNGGGPLKNYSITTLTDKMGNVLKRYVYLGTDKQVTIDVSTLKADIYYLKLFNGKQWQGKSFMKL